MGYRVRSPEGELRFEHFVDIANAYRQGLVDPDDVVLEDGKSEGVKAREHPLLGERPARKRSMGGPQRLQVAVACALGLAALWAWGHRGWSLYIRATVVAVLGVGLAMLLMPIVQAASRPRR